MAENNANNYSEGYFYGILDIYVALMSTPDSPSTKPTYGNYQVMGKTIEAQITPNYKEGKVYASNVATRNEKRVDSYTVSLNLDKIPYAMREKILAVLRHHIAGYAIPREIIFRDALPKTLVGKVAFRLLEEEANEEAMRQTAEGEQ